VGDFYRVEDLIVYQKLCDLHLEIDRLTRCWPAEERFELSSQVRRSSNSSPANLAEKHSDRHVRNKIEGINRARGEALETVHHLYIALRKGYLGQPEFSSYRDRYQECVRMLNGLERTLERQLEEQHRRFPLHESPPHQTTDLNPEP
jgi:four helix bundle protein